MSRRQNLIIMGFWILGGVFCPSFGIAQTPEREYVIGVGDQLNIQVFNQVQPLANFSTQAEVRTDRMITMPWLGDIKVAGLKKSTLTSLLESKEYLGRFLTDPHVTITPARMAANILVVFSGVVNVEQEIPRDAKFGQLLSEITPSLQQYEPNFEAISISSFEGEVFAPDPNLRLQWGDEISIPESAPTPIPLAATPLPKGTVPPLVQFTDAEYEAFQDAMQDYPEAYERLLPLVRHEPTGTFIDLAMLTAEQQAELPQAVIETLQQYLPKTEQPLAPGLELLGIRRNLNVDGLQEAFLALPQPDGERLIRRYSIGDVIQPGEPETEDLVLFEIYEEVQQVLIKRGNVQEPLSLTAPLSDLALVGIIRHQQGPPEAIVQKSDPAKTETVPTQRKRYAEGQEVAPGIMLVKILADQQLAILQNDDQAVQVLFLRDPRKRPSSTPSDTSGQAAPLIEPTPLTTTTPAPTSAEADLHSLL